MLLLVVLPAWRESGGPFGLFRRPARVVDVRARALAQPTPVVREPRPELWLTPVGTLAFPSELQQSSLAGARDVVRGRYEPKLGRRVISLPPMRDPVTKSTISVVAAVAHGDDIRTPGPLRPDLAEPTEITIMAMFPGTTEVSGCVLAIGVENLDVAGAVGGATPDKCGEGLIITSVGPTLKYAVRYERLPNYRTRDGAWREGGILGATDVWVSVTDAA